MEKRSPQTACLISFLIVGGGQFYNGQNGKGILFLSGAVFGIATFGILTFILWIYSMFDAYSVAKSLNIEVINNSNEMELNIKKYEPLKSDNIFNNSSINETDMTIKCEEIESNYQNKVLSTTESPQINYFSFRDMNDKFAKLKTLYDDGMLSYTEFSQSKSNYILGLNKSNLKESKEDFLLGILPLKKNDIISDDEISNLKERIL
ncbi:MAG: TM2 domain-containing protein [Ignavibacteria bacterium]|nr:TM2 domain-containing protein [Ignavibacteria bacterium]